MNDILMDATTVVVIAVLITTMYACILSVFPLDL
jgi:hypothetical protein